MLSHLRRVFRLSTDAGQRRTPPPFGFTEKEAPAPGKPEASSTGAPPSRT